MTVAIAATGPRAGKAILEALKTAELICSGAIGGFVCTASLTETGVVLLQNQQGGVTALRDKYDCETFDLGSTAGLISSGPHRPEPLSDYIAADSTIGLVTGHRLPNAKDVNGKPMNRTVLDLLAKGRSAKESVTSVIDANPAADCGLIAIDSQGCGYAANTEGVDRPDLGGSSGQRNHAKVWVLHNAVQPAAPLAELLVTVALDVMQPSMTKTGEIKIGRNCSLTEGQDTAIHVDQSNCAIAITANQATVPADVPFAVNLGFQPSVYRDDVKLGHLLYEPFLMAQSGKVLSLDGEQDIIVPVGVHSI